MRKLASVREASDIMEIPNADAIEAVQVDGWVCVTRRGEFSKGDLGVYFEIDSFLPDGDERFDFLPKIKWNGLVGSRLRTIRLRGQISQGLFIPLSKFPELNGVGLGDDVTEILNIEKWERPIPVELSGVMKGNFPHYIPKTDQERVQNIKRELYTSNLFEDMFEVSIKLDGSSMTVYKNVIDGEIETGVCSMNMDIIESESNIFWRVARENKLIDALLSLNGNYAFQGELVGDGIQGNYEKVEGNHFYLYDIFNIDKQRYLLPSERMELVEELRNEGFEIEHVPIINKHFVMNNTTITDLLEYAEGKSLNETVNREGVVFKQIDENFSFKVISNSYLEANSDR